MMTSSKPKSRIQGRDSVSCLYRAIERYVREKGGGVVVIGGIQVMQWPGKGKNNFSIAVACTGKLPKFAEDDE